MSPEPSPIALRALRGLLDGIDDALIVLAATRGQLAERTGRVKARAGLPLRCAHRERRVHARARSLAARFGLPPAMCRALMQLLIDDACRRQARAAPAADPDQRDGAGAGDILRTLRPPARPQMKPSLCTTLLRLLPPPARLAPLLRPLPAPLLARLFQRVTAATLTDPLRRGALQPLEGRVLGILVSDLGLGFAVRVEPRAVQIQPLQRPQDCEAEVRGSLTDLLLLAGRLEDADSLFFQRRLGLTGDTELGLLARNVLDQLDWSAVPLPARILLNRAARLAEAAREAWRAPKSGR